MNYIKFGSASQKDNNLFTVHVNELAKALSKKDERIIHKMAKGEKFSNVFPEMLVVLSISLDKKRWYPIVLTKNRKDTFATKGWPFNNVPIVGHGFYVYAVGKVFNATVQ